MRIHANAKINLSLDVLGERPNGYHDVKMIMQSVNLYDELDIEKSNTGTISITCDNSIIECNESNLIYKAARLFFDYTHIQSGIIINLNKNIPIAAGMAGGSTDAAATLVGLNRLFEAGLTDTELCELGVQIGADVPFCIVGGTYLSEGIGEILTKLPDAPDVYLVIAKPDISVSTKYVYDNLILNGNTAHPDVDAMIDAIKEDDVTSMSSLIGNLLETVTVDRYPIIATMKRTLIENGALNALMSGSGPTVFGIFTDIAAAKNALNILHSTVDFEQGFVTTFAHEGIKVL